MTTNYDVIIIGAGAAGLMCAATAGQLGRKVLLLDHAKKVAEKIRISGGGRCNFTNINTAPENFLSQNPHFCKSALKQYTQHNFIELVESYNIPWHEKKLGQLFCDHSAQDIIDMLLSECDKGAVAHLREISVRDVIKHDDQDYEVQTEGETYRAPALVIATGGLSIPKIGATGFAYDIAKQFDLKIIDPRAALVPLTFAAELKEFCKELSGVSVEAAVGCEGTLFSEGLLFTHRGLSGPSILQISSYWVPPMAIRINLAEGVDVISALKEKKQQDGRQEIKTVIGTIVPKRLAELICEGQGLSGRIADLSDKKLEQLAATVSSWQVVPAGTEGYRTAEVTWGGIDTNELSSRTMEAKRHSGLYFIGEAVDVTGWLGGYNFQWAWSSGVACGRSV